ncbi:aminoglycoside phosphotransferase family protein [Paenibacillus sp. GYB004]|uniref:phosphotransferase family protein n=1 Tax=Paenibacillus sp. GYB004 TaxID=2994393 RepID=UPI002F96CC5E
MNSFHYGERLGTISGRQFQAALDRFQLGRFRKAEKTARGSLGQTIFISSTGGDYVMRGNPNPGQLQLEKFIIDQLHAYTGVPVPAPYHLDLSSDLFGWSYAIMPRLGGVHTDTQEMKKRLSADDERSIARAFGRNLARMQQFTTDRPALYVPRENGLVPLEQLYRDWLFGPVRDRYVDSFPVHDNPYREWLYTKIRFWLEDAKKYSVITSEDRDWVERVLAASSGAFDSGWKPCFVMGDYKLDNVLFERRGGGWEVSGAFDFTACVMGDGIADLPRAYAMYIDKDAPELAGQFMTGYWDNRTVRDSPDSGWTHRFRVHLIHERLLVWGYHKASGTVYWDDACPFRQWMERYYEGMAGLQDIAR